MSVNLISAEESTLHDILRVLLIAQVILGHIVALCIPTFSALIHAPEHHLPEIFLRFTTRFGAQSAYLFVFLSGYMIAGHLIESILNNRPLSVSDFLLNRLAKLYPGVLIGLAVTLLADTVGIYALGKYEAYSDVIGTAAINNYSLKNFVGSLLFFQPTVVAPFGSNAPLWTLGYIFQYYMAGFTIAKIAGRNGWFALLFSILLLALVAVVRPEWSILFAVWVAGGLARTTGIERRGPVFLLCIGGFAFIASNLMPPLVSAAMCAVIGAPIVFGLRELRANWITRHASVIRRLSNKTFLAYVVHFPIVVLCSTIVSNSLAPIYAFAVTTALCLIFIEILSRVIPFTRRKKIAGLGDSKNA